jgi:uncharacterized SAM-binding protein YcdF (DUF218 family)
MRSKLLVGLGLTAMGILAFIASNVYVTGMIDKAQPADAIVVLGAQPGPNLEARIRHGVYLYRKGLAPYLVCAGGYSHNPTSASAIARQKAIEFGVPPENVLVADGAMTTREEARTVKALAELKGWNSVIVVSHPLHLFRASLLFRRAGLTVYTSPTNTDFDLIPWEERIYLTLRETLLVIGSLIEDSGFVPRSLALWLQKHRIWR